MQGMKQLQLVLVLSLLTAVIDAAPSTTNKETEVQTAKLELVEAINKEESSSSMPSSAVEELAEVTTEYTTTTTRRSEVKKFIHRVQTTLERAKPWLEELEKEAKNLEQSAQRFGEGVIKSFTGIVGKLIGPEGRIGGATSFFTRIFGTNAGGYKNIKDNKDSKFCGDTITKQGSSSSSTVTVVANDGNLMDVVDVSTESAVIVKEMDVGIATTKSPLSTTTTKEPKTTVKSLYNWEDADTIFNEI